MGKRFCLWEISGMDKGGRMKKCEYCFEQHGEIVWNIGFINNEWLCLECGDKVENKEEKA